MKEKLQALAQRLWTTFRGFTPGQKAVTLAAVAALLIGGYFLATWKPKPTYAPLYSNLASEDASAIVEKLNSQKIPYRLANGGTEIDVPPADVDKTRLALSSEGLPGSGQSGYSLLDKEGVTTSQFKQQIDYQRAVEGELAKTIQAMDGVQAASVHLAIPQQDVFNDGRQKPTAAVLLTVKPGATLDDAHVQTVTNLVSNSVPGMSAGGVTVSDSDGNVLKAPGDTTGGAVSADTRAKATQAFNNQVAGSIEDMLAKSIGPGHASVQVNSVLDFDQTKTTENRYVYDKNTPPVSETKNSEDYQGAGAGAGGTAGTATNTDTGATTGATNGSGNGSYKKASDTVNNALGTVSKVTDSAPGSVQKMSIAVLLDRNAKNINVGAVTNLIKNGTGFNTTRGDTMSVESLPFDTSQADAAKKAAAASAKAEAAKVAHDKLVGMIKQGVLVLLIAGLFIAAVLASRKRRRPPEAAADVEYVDPEPQPQAPTPMPTAKDLTSIAHRRALVDAAGQRPQDVARALSTWINTKESDR